MKNVILIVVLLIGTASFSQTKFAITDSGKKVYLKQDNTWGYVDVSENPVKTCVVRKGSKEPKWNRSKMWKRMGTRVDDLKQHISIDMDVEKKDIILLKLSEQLGNAVYVLCVDGKKMKYRRSGSVFRKDGEDALKMD